MAIFVKNLDVIKLFFQCFFAFSIDTKRATAGEIYWLQNWKETEIQLMLSWTKQSWFHIAPETIKSNLLLLKFYCSRFL